MWEFGFCAGNCLNCSASLEPWLNLHGLLFLAKGSYFGMVIMFSEIYFLELCGWNVTHAHQKRLLIKRLAHYFHFLCFIWLLIDSESMH